MRRSTRQVADRNADQILIEMYTRLNPHVNREHVPSAWIRSHHKVVAQIIAESYEAMDQEEAR